MPLDVLDEQITCCRVPSFRMQWPLMTFACLKSQTKTMRSNLLTIKMQFWKGKKKNLNLHFPICFFKKWRKERRTQKQSIVIIRYAYLVSSECVLWDKTEYSLFRLLPVCTGSIIQKNHKWLSLLPKKKFQKALHPRGTSRAEFVSHIGSFNNSVSLSDYLSKKKRVVKYTSSKVPFSFLSFSIVSSRAPCTSSAVLYSFADTRSSFKSSTRSAILGFLLSCAILQFVYRCGLTEKL